MEPKDREQLGCRRKNLLFLRPRLYMLERRNTDTAVDSMAAGDRAGPLRRSQSDRTEYGQRLQEKMTPQAECCAAESLTQEEEQRTQRMMTKRLRVIQELVQTERDYKHDLELCIREVVQPLRDKQVDGLDVDTFFSNIESVQQVSATLLSLLEEATTDVEPARQVIGDVFLQIKGPLEDVYKVYCYHHDEAHSVLESYEKEEELKWHLNHCLQSLKMIYIQEGKPNLLDMGSLLIKPIQRVMKYPLLLCQLRNSTPAWHPDARALEDACASLRDINVNINELKRRKDLVLKYKKSDEEESLKEKLSKLNIHSISKKSKRVTNHLKILTRGESQVKDSTFDREEKIFRSVEKMVRCCLRSTALCLQHMQDAMPLALRCVMQLRKIALSGDEEPGPPEGPQSPPNPWDDFAAQLQRQVLGPLGALLSLFSGPQKLIQKRYDKLLDYEGGAQGGLARREFEALNAQLVEELQVFNRAARGLLLSCLHSLLALLRALAGQARGLYLAPGGLQVPPSVPHISEIQSPVLEEVHSLGFVKDNSATFIERKLSFEKKKPAQMLPETRPQTDTHRSRLLSVYSAGELYQAKRRCNATQEQDIPLLEGELVAVLEQKDPLGSSSRWLVDTGVAKGYVYACFLRPYDPARSRFCDNDDDFENISLFVSSRPAGDSGTDSGTGDPSSSLGGTRGKSESSGDAEGFQEVEEQIFYAVHAFEARSAQELSLQEYQRVHVLRLCDLSGNEQWWLAEAQGQKGYVPASYLRRMTYA
ncbi:rho guanine nucleotide exchange factor 38 isoform X2 [Erinaceus europaeus]|uniref:Dynamin-binding protein n=1 Tax=Erinaceus europaeus TaxID=9365 RepID=A0ABM3X0F7_ERIEU|nr:rho guanine nucleotide exchange factor 38 isoform X2 [Erinaceus europaeus]